MHRIEAQYGNKHFVSNLSDEDYKVFNHLVDLHKISTYLSEKGLHHLSSALLRYRAHSITGLLVRNSDAIFETVDHSKSWGFSNK